MRTMTLRVLLVLALAGCGGKEDGKQKPAEAGFGISGPAGPVEVLNGQTVRKPVQLTWKTGSPQDVELTASVDPPDQGVSVTLEPGKLAGGEAKGEVVIRCAETASAGDCKVTLTGKAAKAGTATTAFTVHVPQKD